MSIFDSQKISAEQLLNRVSELEDQVASLSNPSGFLNKSALIVTDAGLVANQGGISIGGTGVIDTSGNWINELLTTSLNTATQQILGEYTFGESGAIAIKTDANNGIWLSPTGLLGKKAGNTTFAIGIDGTATFAGTLAGASGTFGTITAGIITGATIQTKSSGNRVQMANDDFIYFLTDSTIKGKIYCDPTYDLILYGADDVVMHAGGSARVQCGSSSFRPLTDSTYDLGASSYRWNDIFCDEIDISNGIKIKGTTVDETDDGEWGFITALNRTGGDYTEYQYQYKFRTFNLKCGIITSITSESDWNNIT